MTEQASRQVRTQEIEAEHNHGRTTCRPASGDLSGSSRSAGPGLLPVDPACGFWGRGDSKQSCIYTDLG